MKRLCLYGDEAEIISHFSCDLIATWSFERIPPFYVRKLYRVDPVSLPVQKCSKAHGIVLAGGCAFDMYEVSCDLNCFIDMEREVFCG